MFAIWDNCSLFQKKKKKVVFKFLEAIFLNKIMIYTRLANILLKVKLGNEKNNTKITKAFDC